MAAPNIVNVSTIIAKTSVLVVTTSAQAIVTNSAASNKVFKINSLIVANIDGTNNAEVTVDLLRGGVAYRLAFTVVVPADATLVVLSKDASIYLEEGDSLRLTANANSDLEAVCSYEEIS
jgi:hypothetical protein